MRRVHLQKYRAALGDAKADRIEAEADSVEGRYAWIDADKWEAITTGNQPEKPDSSSSQVTLDNSPVNSSEIPNRSPRQDHFVDTNKKPPRTPRIPPPGTVIHRVIMRTTGQDIQPGCGCKEKIKFLNDKGWLWCITHKRDVLSHLHEQARKRGVQMDDGTIRAALAAAWKEWRTLKKRTTDDT